MNKQILINCGDSWFEFTKSKTGQLDFAGKIEGKIDKSELAKFQEIAGSSYFSPCFYVYICESLNMTPTIWVAPNVDISDTDVFDYLLHIGALLAAINAKDSLLAGELYLRRKNTFGKFERLTQFIMEPLCAEILFSLCFGRMQNVNPDDVPIVFYSAQKKLDFDPSRETLEQCFIRWFKKNNSQFTLPLVGTQFYYWDAEPEILINLCNNLNPANLLKSADEIRNAKHDFYSSLKIVAQAEPYNQHDVNSILVSIENIESKIYGNQGLEKVGHIRALAAKVLRLAKKQNMAYKVKLIRIAGEQIVVQMEI